MRKAVVFGGAGFLGSHVADMLSEAGYEVTVFDVRSSPWLRPSQKMVVGDILDADLVNKTVSGNNVVYNFAGIADIDEARQRRLDSIRINILGNSIILEACCNAGVKRYVFASSLYVYSKAGSFYRSTKQACELLIENYREMFGLPYTILRYGSLYGPRADDRNGIQIILKQAVRDGVIVREGDGEEIREYIHIFDAAKFSVEVLADEFANQHVVIAGNQQLKVKDLLQMIRELMDKKIEIEYVPPKDSAHYEITPYSFAPKIAKKFVGRSYLDLGQGILSCIEDIYEELNPMPFSVKGVVEEYKL